MAVWSPLVLIVFALAMRALLLFQIQLAGVRGFSRPSLTWCCTLLALTCPVGILIHECGHYLAGIILGQRFRRIVLGPVEFARGWTVRIVPMRGIAHIDMEPSTSARFRLKRGLCIAAGPLASLSTGLLFVALSSHAGASDMFWIWTFSAEWALLGFLGLIPVRRGTVRSDGFLLWELMRSGARDSLPW